MENTIQYMEAIPASSLPTFCPMLPPVVRRLRDEGKLRSRDVDLISLLMGYKNDRDALVWPAQATLAARLHVRSVDTVQRCLRRIIGLGLIRRVRDRGARGQFDKVKWDLSALWADLDRHLEKSRLKKKGDHAAKESARCGAGRGRPSGKAEASSFSGATMPQTCGPEAEPDSVEKADNRGEADSGPHPPPSAVVVAFRDFSIGAKDAIDWEGRLGEHECLEAARITAATRSAKSVKNATGYLFGVLQKKWQGTVARGEAARALAVKKLAPRPAKAPQAPPAPDPLASIPEEHRTALERQARAQLASERPAMRAGYEGGKYGPVVRDRMRDMLAAGWDVSAGTAGPGTPETPEAVPSAASIAASLPPIPAKHLSAQDLRVEWEELPDARRLPFRDRARREVTAVYGGGTPKPEAVEGRALNLYLMERDGGERR